MTFGAIDIPARGVDDLRKVLKDFEAKLAGAKAQRDRILIDMRKVSAAADAGDQRARFAQGALNKDEAAAGRLVLSLERQLAEARKRLGMAMDQAATIEAKSHVMATPGAGAGKWRWFEITTPDGRWILVRGATGS